MVVIKWLWSHPQNRDLVKEFLANPFCRFCAHGTDEEALPFYQQLAIQDYYYLLAHVKFKALRLNSIPDHDVTRMKKAAKSISTSAEAAEYWLNICTEKLGITESKIKDTPRSAAELGYESYLHSNTTKVTWFGLHIIMVPCYYGWRRLAQELSEDPETKKNTKFYETFIEKNNTEDSIISLNETLNDGYSQWKSKELEDRWLELFRRSLQMEIALFNDALKTSPNLCPIATVHVWGTTYIFSSRDGSIVYRKTRNNPNNQDWKVITQTDDTVFSERLGSSVFSATVWDEQIRLYYINQHYLIRELCLEKENGDWTHGALTGQKFKVLPGSHLDAISTKELRVSDKDHVQIKVIFVDCKRTVWEAYIEKGEWHRRIISRPTPAQVENQANAR
ncbi:heme oxygenase-like protein [Fusarium austroafricanum]|uniref:Heme oxygenase-like protein n=1 Tax=Fusarium austroafricanum TaxID=2364996 RepID=A0A8H4KGH2_9HYPO|nr:heme oxygenase-like protein [Fusarium austroafricanum]